MNEASKAIHAVIFAGERRKLILKFDVVWFTDGVGGFELPGTVSSEIEMLQALKDGLKNNLQTRHDRTQQYDFVLIAPLDWDVDAVTTAFFDMLTQVNGMGGFDARLN